MNCKLDKKFENFLKYNSEKTNEISISNQTNNNNTLNNNEFKENIFANTDRYWPRERLKNCNNIQKNSNNYFSKENNKFLNRQSSSNNYFNYEDKSNSYVKYYYNLLNKSASDNTNDLYNINNDNNFRNLENNFQMQSYFLSGKFHKKNFSRSSSEVQKENYESNINNYKGFFIENRPEIYLDLNKTQSFNNNNPSYNSKNNHNQNYNNYNSNYNYYSSMNLLKNKYFSNKENKIDIKNNKNQEETQNNLNEMKSMCLESKKKYRELLHNHSHSINNNYKINNENITKSYIESYNNKKQYNNNNNLNKENSNDFFFDYTTRTSIDNLNKKLNQNQVYKKVKVNNNNYIQLNKNDNLNLIRKDYSTGVYRPINYSISPSKNSNNNSSNNSSNYSSYINNYMNLKSKNKSSEKVINIKYNNTQKIKDNTKSINTFTTGTNNTFEENLLNNNKNNIKIIESVEELHINYVILLQNTKKLINYQENIPTTIYPNNNNNSFKDLTLVYTQEEEL